MVGRVDADARTEQDVAADRDATPVEDDAVEVGVEVVADLDVPPELAPEGRLEVHAATDVTQQPAEQPLAVGRRTTEARVVVVRETDRAFPGTAQLVGQVVVHLPGPDAGQLRLEAHRHPVRLPTDGVHLCLFPGQPVPFAAAAFSSEVRASADPPLADRATARQPRPVIGPDRAADAEPVVRSAAC